MKKLLLLSVMVMAGLSASAQFKSQPSVNPQTNSKTSLANKPQLQRTFQAVAPKTDLPTRRFASTKKLTLDPAKMKPVTRAQRTLVAQPTVQAKAFNKGKVQNNNMANLQPTMDPQIAAQAKAAHKAPAFVEKYTGMGVDYDSKELCQWTMTPTVATFTNEASGESEEVNVFVDVIPTPDFLDELYPEGIPVKYTVDDDDVVTIAPQAVAHYQDEESGNTVYITLFSANTDDCNIYMKVDENGKLSVTEGNWICFGQFEGVEFDDEVSDSEAFLGWAELITDVKYYSHIETTVTEYYGHGLDYFENVPVDWVMQRGTIVMDDDEEHFFVNMVPMVEKFSEIYPNGIDVEYTQEGDKIIVEPQMIATTTDEEGNKNFILLFSYSAEDGKIVLTVDADGNLTTESGESIAIGAWETNTFNATYETWLGAYTIIDNVKYRLPGAPPVAPEDTSFEPEELILFASLGYSGYRYNDNLAVMGAYAPTTFRNTTMDIATSFDWSVLVYDDDDTETTLTSNKTDFTVNTVGGFIYENFTLTAHNEDTVSDPFIWGTGHCPNNDETGPQYETLLAYAGHGANSFKFSDGTYATMTRQNPDGDLTFYTNWGTPDIYERSSITTIYSYQGKPSTPLYLTGVTLPLVSFNGNDDFNLHIKLLKCERNAKGRITLGEVIAEGDATIENVNAEYDAGLTAVEFTELYKEDEFGMSETVDYLFIEDEFMVVIEGWDNGTFSGVLGSQDIDVSSLPSTWFTMTGEEEGTMHYYTTWRPQLFIGLLGATYGYLYTADKTNISIDVEGGTTSIHVDPMYYALDDETEEPTYLLAIESVLEDGEEIDDLPEWLSVEVANEDYTTATATDDDGEEYEYFVNGIDYDLVFTAEALPEGVESRTCQIVFFQTGAKLTVTISQGVSVAVEGDLNGDGKVDIADAVTVLNIMAAGEYKAEADLNGDQKIDIADFVTVLNIMAAQ